MGKTTVSTLTVNRLTLNWTEDSKRKARPCHFYKTPTKGRMGHSTGGGKTRSTSACMKCAIEDVVATALKPLKAVL